MKILRIQIITIEIYLKRMRIDGKQYPLFPFRTVGVEQDADRGTFVGPE